MKRRRAGNKLSAIADADYDTSQISKEPEFRSPSPKPVVLVGGGKGWTDKDERMYTHIYSSYRRKGLGDAHAKKIAASTVNKHRGGSLLDLLNPRTLYSRAKLALAGPRQTAPPQIRSWLDQYGSETIVALRVCREPINAAIDVALNVISAGAWNKNKKELNYDSLFHLWILVTLADGKTWRLEKNQVVELKESSDSGQHHLDVPLGQPIALRRFIENGEKVPPSLWVYSPDKANCQMFVISLLQGSGLLTPEIKQFTLQNAVGALGKESLASRVGNTLTDLAARFDLLLNGAAFKRRGGAINAPAADALRAVDELSDAEANQALALARYVGEGDRIFDWQQVLPHFQPPPRALVNDQFGLGQIPDAYAREMREWTRSNIEQKIIENSGPVSHRERAKIRRDALRQLQLTRREPYPASSYPRLNPQFGSPPPGKPGGPRRLSGPNSRKEIRRGFAEIEEAALEARLNRLNEGAARSEERKRRKAERESIVGHLDEEEFLDQLANLPHVPAREDAEKAADAVWADLMAAEVDQEIAQDLEFEALRARLEALQNPEAQEAQEARFDRELKELQASDELDSLAEEREAKTEAEETAAYVARMEGRLRDYQENFNRALQAQQDAYGSESSDEEPEEKGDVPDAPRLLSDTELFPAHPYNLRPRDELKRSRGASEGKRRGYGFRGGVINPFAAQAFEVEDNLQNAKFNRARLLAQIPNTHGAASQNEQLGLHHKPLRALRPDITHVQSGFDNIPTGVMVVRQSPATVYDRLAAKNHMLDMLRRRELGVAVTRQPQAALKNAYSELARRSSETKRALARRDAVEQLRSARRRGRLHGGGFMNGGQNLYASSVNENSAVDGVWFDPHPATGPMACAPYRHTNGGWGVDYVNNPGWQFSIANRSSKSLVNNPYRQTYWTPHGLAVNFQKAGELKALPKASNRVIDPFVLELKAGGDLVGSALGPGKRSPATMHFGNQTQRWDGGTADWWQPGLLHAGPSRSTANTPYAYSPYARRQGGNWSSLHIGYADTSVPSSGVKPGLTPMRSPLTPASATWVSSLSTQTGNPQHSNYAIIGGARDRSGYAKSRIGLMPVRNQLM